MSVREEIACEPFEVGRKQRCCRLDLIVIIWEFCGKLLVRERESQETGANDVQLQLYSSLR